MRRSIGRLSRRAGTRSTKVYARFRRVPTNIRGRALRNCKLQFAAQMKAHWNNMLSLRLQHTELVFQNDTLMYVNRIHTCVFASCVLTCIKVTHLKYLVSFTFCY